MAHLQYMPGDPRLVDQLVYELKSKGIFDQFRKDCIADVDTRPAYQNLRQRVENSVSSFLARQVWKPDLNKNQLREKLRKHILDGNYLEQGVERIVDQVVNPKLATVFVPKVEDLVYDYLGITRKKNSVEASNGITDLLPTDLEAVSPGSVKSNEDKEAMEVDEILDTIDEHKNEEKSTEVSEKIEEIETSGVSELTVHDCDGSDDKDGIPLPAEEIRPEDIPPPENSPPKIEKVEIDKIELPNEPDVATDIPLPDEIPKQENGTFFKSVNSDEESSSDSSLRRNMSPLTPIRSYNNENSCDAQQAFDDQLVESKKEEDKEQNTFRFALDTKSTENSLDAPKIERSETDLSYQLNQVNINTFVTPAYEDSSNSNNLQIDYESDANSKVNTETKDDTNHDSEESKKDKKSEEKRTSHKNSHRTKDSHKHSSNRDKKSESKPSSSRDSHRHDKKPLKDEGKHKSSEKDRSRDRSDKKESKDSSRHRSSHKSSHKDSKSHRSSSSGQKHSRSDDKKSASTSQKDKEKSSDKSSSKDKYSKDFKSSSHHSDRDRKSSSSSKRSNDKDKDKKSKKDNDDHYSLSGRGNPNRRSTDRDSNDGSSSSKGSHQPSSSKSSESKKDSKESSSKTDNMSGSGSTTPSDKVAPHDGGTKAEVLQNKAIVRLETHLETPVASPPRLPFVPDITLRKPKIAANFEEAKKIMKMRKFLEEEQRRMNQEAALLLEFQANVRPSLSQVYSSIPGPELEFACNTNTATQYIIQNSTPGESQDVYVEEKTYTNAELYEELNAGNESETAKNLEEVQLEDTTISQHIEVGEESYETVKEKNFCYFGECEKYNSELEKTKYKEFLKMYIEKTNLCNKLYLINCDTYEENVLKDVASTFGNYEIVTYHRNGQLKMPKTKVIKNFNLTTEVSLPIESESQSNDSDIKCQVFSPEKSDCSFDLSNDYDAKLEEMVNKTSRKEIMQIILGDIIEGSPTKMPKIDYITESNIESPVDFNMKRKMNATETAENNNRPVLTPHKIRKMSTSELITSTTQDKEEGSINDKLGSVRSKYLGQAKRVGLSRPKRTELPNSPSSDKSVENYEQNTPVKTSNGKVKAPRHLVQRYETSDLYKPKLHFLSRRNVS